MPIETPATSTIKIPDSEAFIQDVRRQLLQELLAFGFAVDVGEPAHRVFHLYFEMAQRTITRRSRPVRWSRELEAKQLTDEHRNALLCIQAESLAGEDLNPRRSRQQWAPNSSDGLLYDWGIQHFHLGARGAGPMGLAGGKDELLFALVTDDSLYFIDLLTHTDFATYDLIEIVHANWPELIQQYRCPDVTNPTRFSSGGRKKLRGVGALMLVEVSDGTVYFPPGGGISGGGTSFQALQTAVTLANRIKLIHEHYEARAGEVAELIREKSGMVLKELRLVLSIKSMMVFALTEQQSGVKLPCVIRVQPPAAAER